MGFLDWLKEVNEQLDEWNRDEINEQYKDDPVKRKRALRRQKAFSKPGAPLLQPEPEPDLSLMDQDELEELYARTEVEIEALEEKIAQLNNQRGWLRENTKSPNAALFGDAIMNFGDATLREQLTAKKKLLRVIKVKLKKPAPLPPKPPTLDPDEEILDKMKQVKKRETELLAKESDPDIRKEIQLAARKKLDKLREKL